MQISPSISPVNVEFKFLTDDIALEFNETITLELVPSSRDSLPSGKGVYFRNTIKLTITDADGMCTHTGLSVPGVSQL